MKKYFLGLILFVTANGFTAFAEENKFPVYQCELNAAVQIHKKSATTYQFDQIEIKPLGEGASSSLKPWNFKNNDTKVDLNIKNFQNGFSVFRLMNFTDSSGSNGILTGPTEIIDTFYTSSLFENGFNSNWSLLVNFSKSKDQKALVLGYALRSYNEKLPIPQRPVHTDEQGTSFSTDEKAFVYNINFGNNDTLQNGLKFEETEFYSYRIKSFSLVCRQN